MNNPLKIAVAGLGTVGGATLQLIQAQADILSQRCGRDLVVTHVSARDRNRDRGLDLAGIAWVDDPMALATTDVKKRREFYAKIQYKVIDESIIIPIYYEALSMATSKNVDLGRGAKGKMLTNPYWSFYWLEDIDIK